MQILNCNNDNLSDFVKARWTVPLNYIVSLYSTGIVSSLSSETEISTFVEMH